MSAVLVVRKIRSEHAMSNSIYIDRWLNSLSAVGTVLVRMLMSVMQKDWMESYCSDLA